MEVRLLRAEEYPLLDAIPEPDRVILSPDNTMVAAAFDKGRLVGRLVLINVPHIECGWIDPAYRNGTLPQRAEWLLVNILRSLGAQKAFAFATDERMEDYIRRLGYERFATAWIKEI